MLLTGCQGLPLLDWWEASSPTLVMPLWERYQHCLATDDPATLLQIIEQLERVMLEGPEPPTWMKSWNPHVTRQPLRTAIDPQALGAACTIRSAVVMAERDRLSEARTLYQRVVSRYPRQDWAYYHDQAKDALAALPHADPTVLALRTTVTSSR